MGSLTIAVALALNIAQSSGEFVDSRLAGLNPTNAISRYLEYSQRGAKDVFVPNTNFWLRGVDFSCVSPWNSGGGRLRAGTAISKRHVVLASHFSLWKGVRIVFVGEDGGVCPCYIENTRKVGKTDILIGLLNAELTPNIHPAKILPEDCEKYIGTGEGLPVVTFNQHEQALLTESEAIVTNGVPKKGFRSRKPGDERRRAFMKMIVVGDSGNPSFLLVDGTPILLYCLHGHGYGCGSGPSIFAYRREVQAAMDELCPGYKLEAFDFAQMTSGK